jgi:Zn-finger nucleic acid-binding protein
MNRINFKSISGVLIDVCSDHGVWLDKGELTHLRTFIASGGLDKAQDREISASKHSIERLATRLDNVEFMQNALHRWSLKRIILSGGDILGGGKGGAGL